MVLATWKGSHNGPTVLPADVSNSVNVLGDGYQDQRIHGGVQPLV
jgi:hypothetical protein